MSAQTANRERTTKERPFAEIRLGSNKAAIWKNETESGPRYNVTFSRLFFDEETQKWRSSGSFGRDDLLVVGEVARLAFLKIHELSADDAA